MYRSFPLKRARTFSSRRTGFPLIGPSLAGRGATEFAPAAQLRPTALIRADSVGTIEQAHPRASEASASVARRLISHGQQTHPCLEWANRASQRPALRPPIP